MKDNQLIAISGTECCLVIGGAVDKNAQKALYYVGYALGLAVKIIGGLFSGCERRVEAV